LTLSEAGLLDQAAIILAQSVQLHPGDGIAQGNLGAIYLRQGKWGKAEAALLKATVIDARRVEWWGNLAKLYAHQNRLEEEHALRRAVGADPSDLCWHLTLVEVLLRKKKVEQALEAALKALQYHPENEVLKQMRQDLLRKRQRGEE
jgi:predicted Zn-dependent protease